MGVLGSRKNIFPKKYGVLLIIPKILGEKVRLCQNTNPEDGGALVRDNCHETKNNSLLFGYFVYELFCIGRDQRKISYYAIDENQL